jgi:hypothetical protein
MPKQSHLQKSPPTSNLQIWWHNISIVASLSNVENPDSINTNIGPSKNQKHLLKQTYLNYSCFWILKLIQESKLK